MNSNEKQPIWWWKMHDLIVIKNNIYKSFSKSILTAGIFHLLCGYARIWFCFVSLLFSRSLCAYVCSNVFHFSACWARAVCQWFTFDLHWISTWIHRYILHIVKLLCWTVQHSTTKRHAFIYLFMPMLFARSAYSIAHQTWCSILIMHAMCKCQMKRKNHFNYSFSHNYAKCL